jgi:1-acyl-sn-glycerol-3-phosphate acyltransferase
MVKYLCSRIVKAWGWKFIDNTPNDIGSYVALGAPHTSNWDFITAMTIIYNAKNVKSKFLIKSSWMKFPLNLFFKPIGAVGVDREAIKEKAGLKSTDVLSNLFHGKDKIALWIAPEGTRSLRTKWKTGFYYTAKKANVPIVLAFADWKSKTLGLGKVIYLTDNFEHDMSEIMKFYAPMEGKIIEKFSIDQRFLPSPSDSK